MIFSLLTLGEISGAEYMLLGCGVCTLLYFAACFLLKWNRGKNARKRVLFGWLFTELLCGVLWYLIYFPGGEYHNYGIGGTAGALLWPFVLLVTSIVVTVHDEQNGAV